MCIRDRLYDFIACQSPLRFTQQFPVTALNDTSILKIRNFPKFLILALYVKLETVDEVN